MPSDQSVFQGSTGGQVGPPDPSPIFQLASGFMAAKYLFVASGLGVFEALSGEPLPVDELALRLGVPRRTARITADAMVALGLCVSDRGRYRNGPLAQAYLAGRTPADLRPFLRFWDRISYPRWAGLEAR